jgi:hypothetical protein
MAVAFLTSQTLGLVAKRRLTVSSVAPVYASALSYTHFCVISNATAYRFSRAAGVTRSEGDR